MRSSGPALRDVWEGIRGEPARYGLALSAVAIGMASLALLLAVLGGLEERADRIVQDFGANVVGAFARPGGERSGPRLSAKHAALLRANLDGCTVSTVRAWGPRASPEGRPVIATDESLARVKGWRLVSGRFLDASDVASRERSAVVSAALGEREGLRPGGLVTLRGSPFRIVGVVDAGGGLPAEPDGTGAVAAGGARAVYVPGTFAPPWPAEGSPDQVDAILIQVPRAQELRTVLDAATRLLAGAGIGPSDVGWTTPDTLLRGTRRIQRTIQLTAGTVSVLCLLLGGVTLMSLMISNVRERVAEIGLRRSIGASPRDIALLFVLEGCLVTGAASVVAVSTVQVGLAAFGGALPFPVRPGLGGLVLPVVLAVLLGAAFSYWPARSAARITPAAALRND